MVKVNELRIGNLIEYYGVTITVTGEWIDKMERRIICGNKQPEGIPLTSEWLERFGFRYDTVTYSKERLLLAQNDYVLPGEYYYSVFIHGLSNGVSTVITKVHQLQNLFFALTGEELTVKELQP